MRLRRQPLRKLHRRPSLGWPARQLRLSARWRGLPGRLQLHVDRIAREAAATDVLLSADIPYREGALITLVHEQGTLLHEEYLEDGVRIVAKLPARIAPRLERYRTE